MAPSKEIYRVKWNNFTGVLRSNLRRYLQHENFTDVTLACEGQRIRCHRLILSSASEYFDSLLNSNDFPDASKANTIIYLKDVKFWELKILIEYLYNGEITISEEKLRRVSAIAESLRIKGFAGEEGVIDEDIAKDLGLANVRTRPPTHLIPTTTPSQTPPAHRLENALKRKAPAISTPPKLIKIQKPGEIMRPNLSNSNGFPTKERMSRDNVSGEQEWVLEPKAEGHHQYKSGSPGIADCMDDDDNELEIAEVETSGGEENPASSSDSESEEDLLGKDEIQTQEIQMTGGNGRKSVYKYSQEVREKVLSSLLEGMTLRQCSESFGIPRKTISKWKQKDAEESSNRNVPFYDTLPMSNVLEDDVGVNRKTTPATPQVTKRRGPGVSIDTGDRAERLEAAMKLALSGTTVRQAAVTYEIPRTTLCAYMKRKGIQAAKPQTGGRIPVASCGGTGDGGGGSSALTSSASLDDGFPFLGLSCLVGDMDMKNDYVPDESDDLYPSPD